MEVLFVFLKWVASFSHVDEETGSKMDLQNLATVIAPNILYPKNRDLVREESFMSIRVVTLLLEYQDDFFTVPTEMLPMLHDQDYFVSCLDMPSKDALRKFETYMRIRQGRGPGAPPPPQFPSNGSNGGGPNTSGDSNRGVQGQRSDPMLRGRPNPPFAGDGQSGGGSGKRSPRSQSRGPASGYPGPPPSSSHGHSSANGHTSSSSPPDQSAFWGAGSPSASSNLHSNMAPNVYGRQPQSPGTSTSRGTRLPQQVDGQIGGPRNWEPPPRSRPGSPYGNRQSLEHSRLPA
jgi:hypothetical protein